MEKGDRPDYLRSYRASIELAQRIEKWWHSRGHRWVRADVIKEKPNVNSDHYIWVIRLNVRPDINRLKEWLNERHKQRH